MTKFITKGLITTFLLVTIFTYAGQGNGNYILNIATGNGKMLSFTLDTVKDLSFSIYDQNHNLVYTGESEVNKLEVSKTISLEGYVAGTYFLEVMENGKIIKHEIKVPVKKAKTHRIDESVNESPSFRR